MKSVLSFSTVICWERHNWLLMGMLLHFTQNFSSFSQILGDESSPVWGIKLSCRPFPSQAKMIFKRGWGKKCLCFSNFYKSNIIILKKKSKIKVEIPYILVYFLPVIVHTHTYEYNLIGLAVDFSYGGWHQLLFFFYWHATSQDWIHDSP